MRKLVLGPVKYAADRAFIPVIEVLADTGDAAGACFARLFSLIILEGEGASICPFDNDLSLSDLCSVVPELEQALTMARRSL
jgi:hypothetical protein